MAGSNVINVITYAAFVEADFPEPGHYALVDHDMRRRDSRRENSAGGIVDVR